MSEFGCLALGRDEVKDIQPNKAARERVAGNSNQKFGHPPAASEIMYFTQLRR
jgi:hypothetical protein